MRNMESCSLYISEQKRLLRRELLEKRRGLEKNRTHLKSMQICGRIQEMQEFLLAPVIYGYIPVRGEVDVIPLIEEGFRQGKRIALPRCLDRQGHMAFFEIQSFDDLVLGAFRIPEPRDSLKRSEVTEGLMLVPGVGFDPACGRLGYGGGYYDRYIGAKPRVSYIAPAYALQMVDILPVEEHDARVDMIVTEEQIFKRRMVDDGFKTDWCSGKGSSVFPE